MQIRNFPRKSIIADDDLLLVQNANNSAYQSVTKSNLLLGLSNDDAIVDPIPLMSDLTADWRAENVLLSTNNLVSQITDNSSNSNHATQVNSANQATLIVNALNNKPVIRFSGNQWYRHSNLTEPATIIAAVSNSPSGYRTIISANSSNAGGLSAYYFRTNLPDNRTEFFRPNVSPGAYAKAAIEFPQFYIQSGRFEQNKYQMFYNTYLVAQVSATGTAANITPNGLIGAGYFNNNIVDFLSGDIYRICMFSQPLSYENLFTAITYLKKSLGI